MIDRTLKGYVVDFLDFIIGYTEQGMPIHFATFNVADTFVCIGVGLFALYMILDEIKTAKREKEEKAKAGNVVINVENNISAQDNSTANVNVNIGNISVNAEDSNQTN